MRDSRQYLLDLAITWVNCFILSSALISCAVTGAYAQTTVVISDTTFNPADWFVIDSSAGGASQTNEQTIIFSDTSVFSDDFETDPQNRWQVIVSGSSSGPTGIQQTVRYENSGGSPGGFRAMTTNVDGSGSIFVSHIYTAQYYLPSEQGAISSLNYTEDRLAPDGRSDPAWRCCRAGRYTLRCSPLSGTRRGPLNPFRA